MLLLKACEVATIIIHLNKEGMTTGRRTDSCILKCAYCRPDVLFSKRAFTTQQPHNQKQLSAWLRPHVVAHPNFGSASASLTRFFKDREAAAAAVAKAPPPGKPASPVRNSAFTSSGSQANNSARTGARFLGAQVRFRWLISFPSLCWRSIVRQSC